MRKRITTLLLTLVMVLSLLVPAYAAESDSTYASDITAVVEKSDSSVVTSSMLSQLYGLLELDYSGEATQQDVVVFLFRYAGMEDSQLSAVSYKDNAEQFEYDCNELAKSIGLLTGISYDADASCSVEQFSAMLKNVEVLYNALHADAMQPCSSTVWHSLFSPIPAVPLRKAMTMQTATSSVSVFMLKLTMTPTATASWIL